MRLREDRWQRVGHSYCVGLDLPGANTVIIDTIYST